MYKSEDIVSSQLQSKGFTAKVQGHAVITVGKHEQKTVSALNHELYLNAQVILEAEQHLSHIGWSGVGTFIDWLESNYDIKKNRVEAKIITGDELKLPTSERRRCCYKTNNSATSSGLYDSSKKDRCSRPATLTIDGIPLCAQHAGRLALSHILITGEE